jgi:hypothetical protein
MYVIDIRVHLADDRPPEDPSQARTLLARMAAENRRIYSHAVVLTI